jgi:hypothetical protein
MRKRNDVFVKSERLTCDDSRALRAEYHDSLLFLSVSIMQIYPITV